jgi:PAS domain S-box-containing protein
MEDDRDIEQLRESEEKYRKMVELAGDAIFSIDTADGTVLEVNGMAETLTSMSRDDLVGRKIWDLHPEEERKLARQLFQRVVSTGEGTCHELHLLRADGSTIITDITASVIEYGDKTIIQRICRDVSSRRRLEQQNKYLKNYYEYLLNMMPVGLGVLRNIANTPEIEFENKKLRAMFECCEKEKLSWRWNQVGDYVAAHTEIMVDDSGEYVEERTLPNDRIYQFKTSYFRDENNTWKEMHIIQDITWRRRLEDELRRANENLEAKVDERTRELAQKQLQLTQAEKMAALGDLVAGIAHEVNTPLGALKSNNDLFVRYTNRLKALLSEPSVPADIQESEQLRSIFASIDELNAVSSDAAARIVSIVTSLRNFARLDQAEKDRVDIHQGIESTLTLVHHQLKNRIEVIKDFGDLPLVSCYPNQLNQVFMNILVNASQAIEGSGEIHIKTRQEGDEAIIEFTDTGRGMAPEMLARVFEPGFTTKRRGIGTGLGLSIVKQIIEDHDGRVEVESQVGKGTTFRIVLPTD